MPHGLRHTSRYFISAVTLLSCLAAADSSAATDAETAAANVKTSHGRPERHSAVSADAFLSSLGVNLHVDQGYDPNSYVEPLRYTGIRQVRDGIRNIPSDIMIHQKTGVHFTLTGGGELETLLKAAKDLAAVNALLALEGPNEPNNFVVTYRGKPGGGPGGTWVPVAEVQRDLFASAKRDPVLKSYPVFGASETGAETDNVGLQFLVIPAKAQTLFPGGTKFADYVNVHNYVSGNGHNYGDNQAWNAADPTLNDRWDGLYANNGLTWNKKYQGYRNAQLATVRRVTTETGWDTSADAGGQHTQGAVLTNTYLAQFKRGWRYTFIYEMRDGEGSTGDQGLYNGSTPKLAATYIHNLTQILSDEKPRGSPGYLRYSFENQPPTVHDLLLQKSGGQFDLIIWDERAHGSDQVVVGLDTQWPAIDVYDITRGTSAAESLKNVCSVPLTLSDHAMILEFRAPEHPAKPTVNCRR